MDHTIIHFEIPAEDIERLGRFYREVFGWNIKKEDTMDYWTVETVPIDPKGNPTRPGINGGMLKKQNPEHRFTYYISVESIEEYSRKVEENGGKIIVPKMEVPNIGWWALATDPEGNQFGIFQELQR
jgi:predicted enzyme related to lactoylglutathione lyase